MKVLSLGLAVQLSNVSLMDEDLLKCLREETLEDALHRLERQGKRRVDSAIYADLLRRCGDSKSLAQGKRVHGHIEKHGRGRETYLGNYLIEMYGKCGLVEDARRVFEGILDRNVFSWNLMIAAYAQHGHSRDALEVFRRIDLEGVKPTRVTFLSVLDACVGCGEALAGMEIHARVVEGGFESDVVVGTAVANMYGRCSESPKDARRVFDRMPWRDLVSWNSMIVVYTQRGHSREAVQLYWQMLLEGVKPDKFNFSSVIFACSSLKFSAEGRNVHQHVIESGLEQNTVVGNALVHMYGKHGDAQAARRVFDRMSSRDVISWTSMVIACSQKGHGEDPLELLKVMQVERVKLDKVGFTSVIDTCTSLAALEQGKLVHAQIIDRGFESDAFVGSTLVNMYGKCGSLEDARSVFAKLERKDRPCWTSMIGAYAQHGHECEAFELFQMMDLEGEKPDSITLISVLNVCSSSSALTEGKLINASIVGTELEKDELVRTALVDMYGKCGSLKHARSLFDEINGNEDVVLWSAMISAYSQHGDWQESITLFQEMQLQGLRPDLRTLTSVLSACSHGGLIHQAFQCFGTMTEAYGIEPVTDHYICMIDLLGRAGRLDDAEEIVKRMPCKPDVVAWTTLLGSCSTHCDVKRAARAAGQVQVHGDSKSSAPYVSLRNMYAVGADC